MHEETAQRALENVVSIQRTALKKGYRFTATMKDGSTEVVRATATRPYTHAHLHSSMACTGKNGLGAVISFSSSPRGSTAWAPIVKSFVIQEG